MSEDELAFLWNQLEEANGLLRKIPSLRELAAFCLADEAESHQEELDLAMKLIAGVDSELRRLAGAEAIEKLRERLEVLNGRA